MTTRSTWYAHQCIASAGLAVMDAVANEEFLADVRAKGERLRARRGRQRRHVDLGGLLRRLVEQRDAAAVAFPVGCRR